MGQLVDEMGLSNIAPVHQYSGTSPDYSTRMAFNNLSGVPWNVFDGVIKPMTDTYASYLLAYNTRKAIASPVTVTVLSKTLSSTQAYVKIKVEVESTITAGKQVYIFLWEDHVTAGTGTWRFIERSMTSRNLTITNPGQSEEFEHTFVVDAGWKQADLGFAAFVQDPSGTKEVSNSCASFFETTRVESSSLGRIRATYK